MIKKAGEHLKRLLVYYLEKNLEILFYCVRVIFDVGVMFIIMGVLGFLTEVIVKSIYGPIIPTPGGVDLMQGYTPQELLGLALMVGILEETLFRYLIQDCLLFHFMRFPRIVALVLAAIAFGAVHLQNPGGTLYRLPQAVAACGAGLYLGYIFNKTGLHRSILCHAAYDFCVFCMMVQ